MAETPVATASRLRRDDDARDAGAPADVYARYQRRLAARSARTLDRSRELLDCVSRGVLTPGDLESAFQAFARTRGDAHTRDLTATYARFFAGLARVVTEPWLASGTEPAAVADDTGGPAEFPPPDAVDPGAWFEQLAAEALRRSSEYVEACQAKVMSAAERSGPATGGRRTGAGQIEGAARLSRLTALYLGLIDGLGEAAAAAEDECVRGVFAAAHGSASGVAGGLQLDGRVGDAALASLSIENTTGRLATIRCSVSAVRRADGIGPAFAPQAVVTPDHVVLDAGEDTQVRLRVALEAGAYEPGTVYVGMLHIHRDDDPRLDVPLRIIPARAGDPSETR